MHNNRVAHPEGSNKRKKRKELMADTKRTFFFVIHELPEVGLPTLKKEPFLTSPLHTELANLVRVSNWLYHIVDTCNTNNELKMFICPYTC